MITLCIAFLNTCTSLFNKNDEFIKYAKYVEIYLFVYVSSVTLTCSNLTKCALAFDRIFKLKGKFIIKEPYGPKLYCQSCMIN